MYWFMSSAECGKCGRCAESVPGSSPAQACGNDIDEDGHGSHCAGSWSSPLHSPHACFPSRICFLQGPSLAPATAFQTRLL
jgi:hypothetical protein